jgi:NAD(P)-dependent dehydrogenase (short-subunit alcohol dehydrogenase family)
MSALLTDRVVVVTGGFGALGRALADVLNGLGARVALLDRAAAPAGLQDSERRMLCGSVDCRTMRRRSPVPAFR